METPLPQGFKLAVADAGFKHRKVRRNDLALVCSDLPASGAGVFTTNLFVAAPVQVAKQRLAEATGPRKWAMLLNSGQANACTGEQGLHNCLASCAMLAEDSGIAAEDVLPASTGVIGAQMDMNKWRQALPALVHNLGQASLEQFARAIMTTDAFPKLAQRELKLQGGTVRLAGAAKGAGMICPNMATMLGVLICDAQVEDQAWQDLFVTLAKTSFNRVTVDGDTSTNDTLLGFANGGSGVQVRGAELDLLARAVAEVLDELAYLLVKDGEGATKVLKIKVTGAKNNTEAEQVARAVGHSQLVKTAMYGRDPNWGRIVAAAGRAGVDFDPQRLVVTLCGVELFRNGTPTDLDFDALLEVPLQQTDLNLDLEIGDGPGNYLLLASDLSQEYVKINSDYRS